MILEQPAMNTLVVVQSTLYQVMKLPTDKEVGGICGNQNLSRYCYLTATKA